MRIYFLICLIYINFNIANSDTVGSDTGLQIPRFVSLKSDDSNIRIGPSKDYPIILNYEIANIPLQIIEEYDEWRKIIDFENNVGWIHKSLIKSNRYGIVNASYDALVQINNKPQGSIVGKIGNRNIVKINKCLIEWCLIEINNNKGWIIKNNLWGVDKNETINIPFYQPIIDQIWKINF